GQHLVFDAEINQVAFQRNSLAVHDVELGLAERRRDLVFYHLDLGAIAGNDFAVFDRGNTTDVDAHGRVKLERPASAGRLGTTEHYADLFANLIDKNQAAVGLENMASQLAQRL